MAYKAAALKLLKNLGRAGKNIGIGAAAGALAGGIASSSGDAPAGRRSGALIGGAVGGAASLPFGKLARAAQQTSAVFARGLKATPKSNIGAALRKMDSVAARGTVVFRRIRGRIIPVRVK